MSNLIRTIQQVTRDYVDSISHRLPAIKNGTVTATSSDGTATVRVDGDTATTGSVPSIATVKTGDRVKMVLFNRQLTILGAIQRTDKLLVDIEATGTTGGWDWIKYTDGRAEASIEGTQTFAHTTQSGSMYLDLNQYPFDIALPSGVFVGNPRPLGNCMGYTSTLLNLWVTTAHVKLYTAAFASRLENHTDYNIKLEGRWK